MSVNKQETEVIRKVLERLSLEVNDNVIELYHNALCRLFNEPDTNMDTLVAEGFDKDALDMLYEIEMDNE
ncbi:hypothetical protein R7Q39_10735 [Vibrio sp. 947]|uniref:hypothetical protein n=1 Tax=Vibrio TaxID=662 RepID=UPI0006A64FFC|nr:MULTISPECIES: hypothetical protein [unclassified Vibrio]KOF27995.1 hypothetical protein ACX13_15165 [Vibrio parahaemolyticus]MCS0328193.1 hypothetical protein [Vibrio diabolicus]MDW1582249.1 hypothetical protein [Vibrio sp. Vb2897]MDW1640510.1 hypothetical protein [Vibrio sp. Vb2896]MDW1925893.1 hypothetical protein [Vibrio sp. 947]